MTHAAPLRPAALVAAAAALILGPGPATRAEDAPGVAWPEPGGSLTIARPFAGSAIALRLSARVAGAVEGLTWDGVQFIDAADHGRELQSASSFDGYGACLNPTEAGSDADRYGPTSTSLLLALRHGRTWAETRTRMAWWQPPGETEAGCPRGPGPYDAPRSDHVLEKRVTVGLPGVPNAVEVRARFELPRAYAHATFEVLTGYMPPSFTRFLTFDPATHRLAPLSDGPGEQGLPVILATPDGRHAMGVWSPDLPQPGQPGLGYGRWNFSRLAPEHNPTVKWNCVARETAPAAGAHAYACVALVGSLKDVRTGLVALTQGARPGAPAAPPASP